MAFQRIKHVPEATAANQHAGQQFFSQAHNVHIQEIIGGIILRGSFTIENLLQDPAGNQFTRIEAHSGKQVKLGRGKLEKLPVQKDLPVTAIYNQPANFNSFFTEFKGGVTSQSEQPDEQFALIHRLDKEILPAGCETLKTTVDIRRCHDKQHRQLGDQAQLAEDFRQADALD